MIRWNDGPCGFDGGLKLNYSFETERWKGQIVIDDKISLMGRSIIPNLIF